MSYNTNHAETNWRLSGGQILDVSSTSVSYVAVPHVGTLVDAWCCISAAITSANSVITIKKKAGSATAVTLGTITVLTSGSAPGSTYQAVLTGSEIDRTFAAGDTLQFDNAAGSSTTSIGNFLAVFRGM